MIKVLRRRGKEAQKFRFSLTIHSASVRRAALSTGWSPEGKEFSMVWTHGGHTEATSPARVVENELTWDERLVMTGTLYKNPSGSEYDAKNYKLRLREDGKRGKTRGSLVLNFADMVQSSPFHGSFAHKSFSLETDGKKLNRASLELSLDWQRISKSTGAPISDAALDASTSSLAPESLSYLSDLSSASDDDHSDSEDEVEDDDDSHDGNAASARGDRASGKGRGAHHSHHSLDHASPAERAEILHARALKAAQERRQAAGWAYAVFASLGYLLWLPLALYMVASWDLVLKPGPGPKTLSSAPLRAGAGLGGLAVAYVWTSTLLWGGAAAVGGSLIGTCCAVVGATSVSAVYAAESVSDAPFDLLGFTNVHIGHYALAVGSSLLIDVLASASFVLALVSGTQTGRALSLLSGPPDESPDEHYLVSILLAVGDGTLGVLKLATLGPLLLFPWRLSSISLSSSASDMGSALLAGAVDTGIFAVAALFALPTLSILSLFSDIRNAPSFAERRSIAYTSLSDNAGWMYGLAFESNVVGRSVVSGLGALIGLLFSLANSLGSLLTPQAPPVPAKQKDGETKGEESGSTLTSTGAALLGGVASLLVASGPTALVALTSLLLWIATSLLAPVRSIVATSSGPGDANTDADAEGEGGVFEFIRSTWVWPLEKATGACASIAVYGSPLMASVLHVFAIAVWIVVPIMGLASLTSSLYALLPFIALLASILRTVPSTLASSWAPRHQLRPAPPTIVIGRA